MIHKATAFKSIQSFSSLRSANQKIKTHIVYSTLQNKMQLFYEALLKIKQRNIMKGFLNITIAAELRKEFGRTRSEIKKQKEEFAQALKLKTQEISNLNKKMQVLQEANQTLKAKEGEYINKLKSKDKLILNYESEQQHDNTNNRAGTKKASASLQEREGRNLKLLEQKVNI